ncbi:MAG: hypothetical protein VX403_10950 [Planctomycetota bacterium]|nr:hypothetical protein [Planctomycetota bacterium]
MITRTLALTSVVLAGGVCATVQAQCEDEYVAGTALVVLTDQFAPPAGAAVLGANLPFPLNPFPPCVNGGPAILFDASTFGQGQPDLTNQTMDVSKTFNTDTGRWEVSIVARTTDGAPFLQGANLTSPLFTGGTVQADENPGARFVIDFGNGYEQPTFPVNGVSGVGGSAGVIPAEEVIVDYYYRGNGIDNGKNGEVGNAPVVIREDGSMTFAWGFQIADAQVFNECGVTVKFFPTVAPVICACTTDLDGNCEVNGADLAILLGQWATAGDADVDGSGSVDGADLALLLGEWNNCGESYLVADDELGTLPPQGACCYLDGGVTEKCVNSSQRYCESLPNHHWEEGARCYVYPFSCPSLGD